MGGWLCGSNENKANRSPVGAGAGLNFAMDYFGSQDKAKLSSPPPSSPTPGRVKMLGRMIQRVERMSSSRNFA